MIFSESKNGTQKDMNLSFQCLETIQDFGLEYRRHILKTDFFPEGRNVGIVRSLDSWKSPKDLKTSVTLFHGGDGDDRQLIPLNLLADLSKCEAFRSGAAQCVLPDAGVTFLRNAEGRQMEDWFLREVLPWTEVSTAIVPERRFISGLSMGGLIALSLFFRRLSTFGGAYAFFPALLNWDVTSEIEAHSYCARMKLVNGVGDMLKSFFGQEFSSKQEHDEYSPLELAKRVGAASLAPKRIGFEVGTQDDLGLVEGVIELHHLLNANAVPHRFETVKDGRHHLSCLQGRIVPAIKFLTE